MTAAVHFKKLQKIPKQWLSVALTLRLSLSLSLRVSVSALAMTGTTLTLLWMAFMNCTSRGFRLVAQETEGHTSDFSVSEQRRDREEGAARRDTPVAERGDEVEAAVDSVVDDVSAIEAALVVEVALKLVVDVADDGVEAGRGQLISCQTFRLLSRQETCPSVLLKPA